MVSSTVAIACAHERAGYGAGHVRYLLDSLLVTERCKTVWSSIIAHYTRIKYNHTHIEYICVIIGYTSVR
jgi:hypothetical protein